VNYVLPRIESAGIKRFDRNAAIPTRRLCVPRVVPWGEYNRRRTPSLSLSHPRLDRLTKLSWASLKNESEATLIPVLSALYYTPAILLDYLHGHGAVRDHKERFISLSVIRFSAGENK